MMENALIDVRFVLNLPKDVAVPIIGDDPKMWDGEVGEFLTSEGFDKLELHMKENFHKYLDYMVGGDADVEAMV